MATYMYRCDADGSVDARWPIGTAPATIACPACGRPSARVITAPMLGLSDHSRMAVIDRAEASRTEPAVVSGVPPALHTARQGQAPSSRPDPRTSKLPRP